MNVFKFADPIFSMKYSIMHEVLYAACWDNTIRCLDLEESKIVKSFVAATDAIRIIYLH